MLRLYFRERQQVWLDDGKVGGVGFIGLDNASAQKHGSIYTI